MELAVPCPPPGAKNPIPISSWIPASARNCFASAARSMRVDSSPRVHPEVMDAMNEVGLDLSRAATSSPMTEVAQRLSC